MLSCLADSSLFLSHMGICGKYIIIVNMMQSEIPSVISGMETIICNVKSYVMKLKSHEGSPRVTKGNVKGHPTLCYKYSIMTHCIGFWSSKLPIRLSWKELG